jgi:hypothetical protein
MTKPAAGFAFCMTIGLVGLTAQAPVPVGDALYAAIRGGDMSQVSALLRGGADVNVKDRRGGATP